MALNSQLIDFLLKRVLTTNNRDAVVGRGWLGSVALLAILDDHVAESFLILINVLANNLVSILGVVDFVMSFTHTVSCILHHIGRITVLVHSRIHLVLTASNWWELLHELNVLEWHFPLGLTCNKNLASISISIRYR